MIAPTITPPVFPPIGRGPVLPQADRPSNGRARLRRIFWHVDNCCCYCRTPIEYGKGTIEHVHPRARSGRDDYENVTLCCDRCNTFKANRTLQEFRDHLIVMLTSVVKLSPSNL